MSDKAIWFWIIVGVMLGGFTEWVYMDSCAKSEMKHSAMGIKQRALEMGEGEFSKINGKFCLKSYKWSYILTGQVPSLQVDKEWLKTHDNIKNEAKAESQKEDNITEN